MPNNNASDIAKNAVDESDTYRNGWRAGLMRAHKELMTLGERCKINNSSITYVGLERLGWDMQNLSKDPTL